MTDVRETPSPADWLDHNSKLTCEHRRVRRHFINHVAEDAERLAKNELVLEPNVIKLHRDARHQQHEVRHRQAEEVVIGCAVHRLVPSDDDARRDVADTAGDEDDHVDESYRHDKIEGISVVVIHELELVALLHDCRERFVGRRVIGGDERHERCVIHSHMFTSLSVSFW